MLYFKNFFLDIPLFNLNVVVLKKIYTKNENLFRTKILYLHPFNLYNYIFPKKSETFSYILTLFNVKKND